MKPKSSDVVLGTSNQLASRAPTSDEARAAAETMRPLRADLEAAIQHVLHRPPQRGETQL